MIKRIATITLWVLILTSVIFFLVINIPPILGIGNEKLDRRRALEQGWLITHLGFGTAALFLGAIQFWPGIRNNYPKWHRLAGKFYILCSIVAALMAFYLLSNYPLPASVPGFSLLAILWLFTTIAAYLFARKKDFTSHKQFMTRSYVCALAFVFVRLLDKIDHFTWIFSFIKNDDMRATLIDWSGWLIPVMITEFFLQWWPALKRLTGSKNNMASP